MAARSTPHHNAPPPAPTPEVRYCSFLQARRLQSKRRTKLLAARGSLDPQERAWADREGALLFMFFGEALAFQMFCYCLRHGLSAEHYLASSDASLAADATTQAMAAQGFHVDRTTLVFGFDSSRSTEVQLRSKAGVQLQAAWPRGFHTNNIKARLHSRPVQLSSRSRTGAPLPEPEPLLALHSSSSRASLQVPRRGHGLRPQPVYILAFLWFVIFVVGCI